MSRVAPEKTTLSAEELCASGYCVYSVGHSTLPLDDFLKLLRDCGINWLIDVRSVPCSRIAPQFDKADLQKSLEKDGFHYLYLGYSLGGKPVEQAFYDEDGRVDYARLAGSLKFFTAIEEVVKIVAVEGHRVAIMCGEENPVECHRRLLIGRVLSDKGIRMIHIRANGKCEIEETYGKQDGKVNASQIGLFEQQPEGAWKSIRSVSQAAKRKTSSPS